MDVILLASVLAYFHGKWRAATQWMLGGPSNSS
jgi:hypothetical protein